MQAKRWVLRYHGGPTRIIQSGKPITDQQAKAAYMKSKCWTGTDQISPDDAWPQCKPVADEDMGEFGALMAVHPTAGKPLALIEV